MSQVPVLPQSRRPSVAAPARRSSSAPLSPPANASEVRPLEPRTRLVVDHDVFEGPASAAMAPFAVASMDVASLGVTAGRSGDGNASRAVVGSMTGASSLSALPALPDRRLPALRDALVDPAIEAMSFGTVRVPPDVMHALAGARRVLVVGHVPPDGDCVGSAAGLAAALRAAGKEAVAVVDDALPSSCRAIDHDGSVGRADDVQGPFDLVVLVDVAQRERIGGAARFLGDAGHVLVLDHHEETPGRESLGVGDHQALTTWIAPSADAAAVLVGGVAAALGPAALAASERPLAAAMYTDTLGFRAPGADLRTLQLFKGVVGDVESLDALETSLRPQLPPAARQLVDGLPLRRGAGAVEVILDAATWQELQALARASDPRMTDGDLRGALCDRLDDLRDQHGAAMMLIDEPAGVRLSSRSVDDGLAREVAEALGGGGHGRAAGALVQRPLGDVLEALDSALRQAELSRAASRRTGRLPPARTTTP